MIILAFFFFFFFFFKQKTAYDIMPSLVGSEMCIRDRVHVEVGCQQRQHAVEQPRPGTQDGLCLLYTSDAADDLLCVDLGGRRIIKKKKKKKIKKKQTNRKNKKKQKNTKKQ